jgi:hypothetical protein
MAVPPSTASPASWKPAVPPPPVTGAAVGIGLNEGLGDGLNEGVGLPDGDGLGEGLGLSVSGLPPPAALVTAEPPAEGERIDTDAEGVDVPVPVPVQAESATQASRVMRQPTAVSRTRRAILVIAASALIDPSSCFWQ